MGPLFVRSSLFRSGALVSAGVMDAGYKDAIGELPMSEDLTESFHCPGGMLQVVNPFGLVVYKNATGLPHQICCVP